MITIVEKLDSNKYYIKPPTGELTPVEISEMIVKIVVLMRKSFGESDMRDLCLYLGMDYEHVSGANVSQKIANLARDFGRQNNLDGLLAHLRKMRPHVDWPEGGMT